MIRLSRLADYAVVVMSQIAVAPERLHTAPELSCEVRLPATTVSKVLKLLHRSGLVTSHRGAQGGYAISRPATAISVADIISAVDGPIALTDCIEEAPGACDLEAICPARRNWQAINDAVRGALAGVSLADLTAPVFLMPAAANPPELGKTALENAGANRDPR
jgi:FeS assembly SUF system regulator